MKKLLLIVFLGYYSHTDSQPIQSDYNSQNQFKLVKLLYDNSSGENGVTFFDYNEKGICEKALWELQSGKRYSMNVHYYDRNNNLIKKVREYSDNKNTVQLFNYDIKSRLIAEEFILLDTSKGISTFEYNSQGQLVNIKCNAFNGWINGEIKLYYNSKNKRERGELIKKNTVAAIIKYEYDANDNLCKEIWEFKSGWQQTFVYEYEKNSNFISRNYTNPNPFIVNIKIPIEHEEYSYGNQINGPSYYRYDNTGKLAEKIYERSDGFKTSTYYFYNSEGVLVRAFRRLPENKNILFRFEYNNKRKMTLKEFFKNDNTIGKETYSYDSDGSLLNAEFKNSDEWLNGTIKFVKAKNGLPASGVYNDIKGFTAEINFNYDKDSLLQNILWSFSFNKEQVYSFYYKMH